ncbi:alanine/glycine:cation symporter family protein [Brevibacterium samyangense]|uniref:Alanine or glycine:cation symporter, AGCS family n=1 Tax=Brevibacterium samyangense TaxID=366888 RepID=A0ABN2TL93_9MICO
MYASVFAFVTVVALTLLMPGVQANGISSAAANAWGIPPWVAGAAVIIVLAFIIVGGVKRIASFAGFVVPIMAVLYIVGAIVVVIMNAHKLPEVIELIVSSAFGVNAAFGGIVGSAIEWGVKRGIYSNEAGQGTGPHSAAAAEVSHPTKQGLVQAGSIYIDTLFVCSATAFMILSTGMYKVFEGGAEDGRVLGEGGSLPEGVASGAGYAQSAFDSVLPGLGASFIAVSLAFFAFTTIVAYYYMAETNLAFLLRGDSPARIAARTWLSRLLQLAILGSAFIGTVNRTEVAWMLGDIGVGIMAWLNITGILVLRSAALRALRDYEKQRKSGLDPQFDPAAVRVHGAASGPSARTNVPGTSTTGSEGWGFREVLARVPRSFHGAHSRFARVLRVPLATGSPASTQCDATSRGCVTK